MAITFTVIGEPQPQGSIKPLPAGWAMAKLRRGYLTIHTIAELMQGVVLTSDNNELKSWRSRVAFEATCALRGVSVSLAGGIELYAEFYLPRPQSISKKYAGPHLKKPDLDKLLRAIGDALTGVLWTDDNTLGHIDGRKYYAAYGEQPRAVITVRTLPTSAAPPLLREDESAHG